MSMAASIEKSLERSFAYAVNKGHEFVTLEHLLWGAIQSPEVTVMLQAMSVDIAVLKNELEGQIKSLDGTLPPKSNPQMSDAVNRTLHGALAMSQRQQSDKITIFMMLLNMLEEPDAFANYFLNKQGVTLLKLKQYIAHGPSGLSNGRKDPATTADGGSAEGPVQSALEKFAVNLNERAVQNKIDPLIGRAYEIERTAQILSRRRKNNPLLVGEPGVGKTAIAEGLAKMIVDKKVPEALDGKQVWSLNLGAMVAGTKYRGDFEQRIKDVIDEVTKDPNIILFIDEIHTLIGAGSAGGSTMDASNIIKPALASGDLRVIGATTFQEYREVFEKEKALERRFQKVDVVEPTPEETVSILKGLKKGLEEHHKVKYTAAALQSAVDLSVKYMPDRFLPDKAIDVLDEAGAAERLKPAAKRHAFIDKDLIEGVVAKITRLPVNQVSQNEKDHLQTLPADLKAVVFGQNEAIDKLSTAVCVAKAGLNDAEKPLGSFLFAGPTGVGKTEVVRQLSKQLGIPLLRFDMSEYMEAHSVARLIGAPPGYVGHDKGGLLTDAVYKSQHCVLLLDEIEKAHPDVYNILLQVMDNGVLTDANGRSVNFKNVFLVMTTNAGAKVMQKTGMGFIHGDRSSEGRQVLDDTFAPEFRNRLDAIVSFKALGPTEIQLIVDKNIRALQQHLTAKGVTLEVSEAAREVLAKDGYVPTMGARPMARLVQELLKKPLAEKMLFGDLKNGGLANVDVVGTEWVWTTTPMVPAPTVSTDTPVKKKATRRAATV